MEKRKKREHNFFYMLAVVLFVCAMVLAVRVPQKSVELEKLEESKREALLAYEKTQSLNNELKTEYAESSTVEFVERTARHDYNYVRYGDIVYEVGNIDQYEKAE